MYKYKQDFFRSGLCDDSNAFSEELPCARAHFSTRRLSIYLFIFISVDFILENKEKKRVFKNMRQKAKVIMHLLDCVRRPVLTHDRTDQVRSHAHTHTYYLRIFPILSLFCRFFPVSWIYFYFFRRKEKKSWFLWLTFVFVRSLNERLRWRE